MNKQTCRLALLSFAFFSFLAAGFNPVFAEATFDFDGDGKSDPTVLVRENNRNWWHVLRSRDGAAAFQWGAVGTNFAFVDWLVPEDYDGDGKWDVAVWRQPPSQNVQSYFYIYYSGSNTYSVISWGLGSDKPIPQDYDGDGKADIAVTREESSGMTWYIMQTRDGFRAERFGLGGDRPIRGDYDGDGKADLAVHRLDQQTPNRDFTFYIRKSSDGSLLADRFGNERQDFVTPGDYDGDGKTDVAVWRGSSDFGDGTWYWHRSSDGGYSQIKWGTTFNPDYPAPGDYDGDGKTDIAVWRRAPGTCGIEANPSYLYINGSLNGFMAIQWGNNCFHSLNY